MISCVSLSSPASSGPGMELMKVCTGRVIIGYSIRVMTDVCHRISIIGFLNAHPWQGVRSCYFARRSSLETRLLVHCSVYASLLYQAFPPPSNKCWLNWLIGLALALMTYLKQYSLFTKQFGWRLETVCLRLSPRFGENQRYLSNKCNIAFLNKD